MKISKLNTEMMLVTELIPYAGNAKVHDDAQVAQIAASIKQYGFNNPILVDETKMILAGHGRLDAARKLGLEEVPVIQLTHLSDIEKRAYILADNKIADNGDYDYEVLQNEIDRLTSEGIDLSEIGFSQLELESPFGEGYSDTLPEPGDADMSDPSANVFGIIITVENEQSQAELLERMTGEGYRCKALL
jgi:ParB-like chromosome segregation protein Spo0J